MPAQRPGGGGGGSTPADGSITAAKLASDAVTKAKVANAAVGSAEIDSSEAAAIRTAIGAASSVVATYDFSSSAGWTTGNTGTFGRVAQITGGYVDLTDTQAHDYDGGGGFGGPEVLRPITDAAQDPTRAELTARVVEVSGGSTARGKLFFRTAGASARVCYIAVAQAGSLTLGGTGITDVTSAAGVLPMDGTGWIRLVRNGKVVSALYGTGTSSTQPTTWTYLASAIAPDHSVTYGSGTSNGWDRLGFALSGSSFPSVQHVARFDDLSVRSL